MDTILSFLIHDGFVAQIPNIMILLYLFLLKFKKNLLKISALKNIYATKPTINIMSKTTATSN